MKLDCHPLVSIVIPCYNHENFVQECIQSVIDQTYQNVELIIIDDGSKDNSVKKIQEMIPNCEERFARFEFRHRPNKGLSATLNEALGWCNGKYYSAIASDDIMLPHKTSKQIELMLNNDVVGVFGAVQYIDENGNLGKKFSQKDKLVNFEDIMFSEFTLIAATQMLLLEKVREIGGYRDGMIIEDWYMWLKLMENGDKSLYINEIFCLYRKHSSNSMSDPYKIGLGYLQVVNEFSQHSLYKKTYIRAIWNIIFSLFFIEPKLTILIFFNRFMRIIKIMLNKLFN
ncbi:glycosyltransferase [Moraxella osloensis]|nr:glycosyltransferase [Moraxella osloensis]QRO13660.1 glycosyltransferase [Moraxella osloensis]